MYFSFAFSVFLVCLGLIRAWFYIIACGFEFIHNNSYNNCWSSTSEIKGRMHHMYMYLQRSVQAFII